MALTSSGEAGAYTQGRAVALALQPHVTEQKRAAYPAQRGNASAVRQVLETRI